MTYDAQSFENKKFVTQNTYWTTFGFQISTLIHELTDIL